VAQLTGIVDLCYSIEEQIYSMSEHYQSCYLGWSV